MDSAVLTRLVAYDKSYVGHFFKRQGLSFDVNVGAHVVSKTFHTKINNIMAPLEFGHNFTFPVLILF